MGQKPVGRVVKILNPYEVVISLGAEDGVTKNDEFVVFEQGEEVTDPDTGESLGILEIVRGQAFAKHVQEKLTTLRSRETEPETQDRRRPKLRSPLEILAIDRDLSSPREEYVPEVVLVPAPFENVEVGDLARKL